MSIRRRIMLVYLLTLLPLTALVLGLLGAWYSAQRDVVSQGRLNNARLLATTFSVTMDDIAATSFVVGESLLAEPPRGSAHPSLQRVVATYPLHFACVLDERGRITQSSDYMLLGRSIEDTAVARVLGGREMDVGVSRRLFGRTGFLLAQRIGGVDGPSGVSVQFVDPQRLSTRLGQNPIGGGAHIVDSAGHLVASVEDPALGLELQFWGDEPMVAEALDGRLAVDFAWSYPPTGARRVGAAVPIAELGWEAGSAIDFETAFEPFLRSLGVASIVGVLVLVASTVATRATAFRVIRSVEALTRQSESVGRRDLEPVGVLRTGDELEQVSEALNRADQDLRAYIGSIEAIGEAGQDLSASFTSGNVHDAIVTAARKLFDASAVWVFLHNESRDTLRCAVWYSEHGVAPPQRELEPGEGVAGRVFSTGEVAIVPDITGINGFAWRGDLGDVKPEALVEIPLLQSHRPIGVMGVLAPGIERWQLGGREIGLLRAFGSEVSIALQNARLYENERLVAETLQQALLLMPDHVAGVDFAHGYYSGTGELKVGGDFYDVFELSEDRVGILIGDVSGKGLEAAVLTSVVKDTVRAHADEPGKSPAQVVRLTNQLVEKQSPQDMFVTLFLAFLDTRTRRLVYCNAGHTTGAIVRAGGAGVASLPSTSPVAGAFPDLEYEEAETTLRTGDVLLLYTDGLTEARRGRDLYGEERLLGLLSRLQPTSPRHVIDIVYRNVLTFAAGELGDDLAMLALRLCEGDVCEPDYLDLERIDSSGSWSI